MGGTVKYYDVDDYRKWKREQGSRLDVPPRENWLAAVNYTRNFLDGRKINWAAFGGLAVLCLGSRRDMRDIHVVYERQDFTRIINKLEKDSRAKLPSSIHASRPTKVLLTTGPAFGDAGCKENVDIEFTLVPPGLNGTPPTDLLLKHQVHLRLAYNGSVSSFRSLNILGLLTTSISYCKSQDITWDPRNDIWFLSKAFGKEVAAVRHLLDHKALNECFFSSPVYPSLSVEDQRRCSMALLGKEYIRLPSSKPVSPFARPGRNMPSAPAVQHTSRPSLPAHKSGHSLEGRTLAQQAQVVKSTTANIRTPPRHSMPAHAARPIIARKAVGPQAQLVPIYSAGHGQKSGSLPFSGPAQTAQSRTSSVQYPQAASVQRPLPSSGGGPTTQQVSNTKQHNNRNLAPGISGRTSSTAVQMSSKVAGSLEIASDIEGSDRSPIGSRNSSLRIVGPEGLWAPVEKPKPLFSTPGSRSSSSGRPSLSHQSVSGPPYGQHFVIEVPAEAPLTKVQSDSPHELSGHALDGHVAAGKKNMHHSQRLLNNDTVSPLQFLSQLRELPATSSPVLPSAHNQPTLGPSIQVQQSYASFPSLPASLMVGGPALRISAHTSQERNPISPDLAFLSNQSSPAPNGGQSTSDTHPPIDTPETSNPPTPAEYKAYHRRVDSHQTPTSPRTLDTAVTDLESLITSYLVSPKSPHSPQIPQTPLTPPTPKNPKTTPRLHINTSVQPHRPVSLPTPTDSTLASPVQTQSTTPEKSTTQPQTPPFQPPARQDSHYTETQDSAPAEKIVRVADAMKALRELMGYEAFAHGPYTPVSAESGWSACLAEEWSVREAGEVRSQ